MLCIERSDNLNYMDETKKSYFQLDSQAVTSADSFPVQAMVKF